MPTTRTTAEFRPEGDGPGSWDVTAPDGRFVQVRPEGLRLRLEVAASYDAWNRFRHVTRYEDSPCDTADLTDARVIAAVNGVLGVVE